MSRTIESAYRSVLSSQGRRAGVCPDYLTRQQDDSISPTYTHVNRGYFGLPARGFQLPDARIKDLMLLDVARATRVATVGGKTTPAWLDTVRDIDGFHHGSPALGLMATLDHLASVRPVLRGSVLEGSESHDRISAFGGLLPRVFWGQDRWEIPLGPDYFPKMRAALQTKPPILRPLERVTKNPLTVGPADILFMAALNLLNRFDDRGSVLSLYWAANFLAKLLDPNFEPDDNYQTNHSSPAELYRHLSQLLFDSSEIPAVHCQDELEIKKIVSDLRPYVTNWARGDSLNESAIAVLPAPTRTSSSRAEMMDQMVRDYAREEARYEYAAVYDQTTYEALLERIDDPQSAGIKFDELHPLLKGWMLSSLVRALESSLIKTHFALYEKVAEKMITYLQQTDLGDPYLSKFARAQILHLIRFLMFIKKHHSLSFLDESKCQFLSKLHARLELEFRERKSTFGNNANPYQIFECFMVPVLYLEEIFGSASNLAYYNQGLWPTGKYDERRLPRSPWTVGLQMKDLMRELSVRGEPTASYDLSDARVQLIVNRLQYVIG